MPAKKSPQNNSKQHFSLFALSLKALRFQNLHNTSERHCHAVVSKKHAPHPTSPNFRPYKRWGLVPPKGLFSWHTVLLAPILRWSLACVYGHGDPGGVGIVCEIRRILYWSSIYIIREWMETSKRSRCNLRFLESFQWYKFFGNAARASGWSLGNRSSQISN